MVLALLCTLLLATEPAWAAVASTAPADVVTAPIPFADTDVARLAAWAWHTTGWEVIPMQVDPRTADGDWDFARVGLIRTTAHDEVVVATADLGPPAPPGQQPPDVLAVVELHGPAGTVAYLARHALDPPRAARRWLLYRRAQEEVDHDGFTLGFEHDRPFVLNRLVWTADPDQRDWIDTGKFRCSGRFMGSLRFLRTRADFTSRVLGVIDGPVRVVVRTDDHLRMAFGLTSPSLVVDRIHTPRTLTHVTRIHIPFRVGWLFDDLAIRSTLDLAPGEARTITCPNHSPTPIDGRPQPAEVALCGHPMEGFTLAGPHGAIHATVTLDPNLKLKATVYYVDDLTERDPPEEIPGHLGEAGVILTGWEGLDRGDYRLTMALDLQPSRP
ncbi:MAG: hypothetical protein COW73_01240 [Nitrospirae bacterium CG18_big_fil_WC_8_21_14_2_50_70_55]|nr:hypothetical protein [Deltaproteobacteria bacterium]OIP67437.1 MAG: hypothetical protein AUK30_00695 [Nitrospirae bacterium CG2_30_70_394]PIQ07004.1 MAG: hypothetical protein COW73_01240 [Nitrospirae bacterium CG18_big_fil_WC_8_21_14_2_50_70_55]PIU78354.1 MAG: hypothetical protein COS73_07355 [Nitrospirae bacterium CG06_land_8_20_14_3_00_70_43]PIW83866.1 MAG: hypothetical protein COZ96_01200 [Nitrospirae bacterium CG_4_8_14_3_um_filter_70_85]PIX83008.1 MAG: hypothetical protein COZ33_07625 